MTSIPTAISRALGIRPGWKLDWTLGGKDDEIVVKVIPDRAERARQLFGRGKARGRGESAVADLIRERMEEDRQ